MADRDVLWRALRQGLSYKWLVASTLALTAAAAATSGYLLVAGQRLFQAWSRVQSGYEDQAKGLIDADTLASMLREANTAMHREAWILISLAPLAAILAYFSWITGQHLANKVMRDLRARFVAHLVRLDLGFHQELSRGDLLARMTADLGSLLNLQTAVYGKLIKRPVEIIAFVSYVFYLSWQFATGIFVVLLPVALIVARLLRRTRKRSQKARESLAGNLDAFEQITAGIRVIKSLGSSDREVQRYADSNQGYYNANLRVARSRAASDAFTEGSIFIFFALGLLGGALMFERRMIEPATLLIVLAALARIINGVREIQRAWGDVLENIPAAERVYGILDRQPAIRDQAGAADAPAPRQAIRLAGVRFRYGANDSDVLNGVDLEIPIGSSTALVGRSGGGKSTLLDLIPRLRDVSQGAVTWDGVDVRSYRADSLVGHCAVVAQEPFLFNDTVFNNIRYGRPAASRAEVEAAARRAHVHDDILRLEGGKGYETVVGDRGGRLSGGQRQRVAIARALLRDAPILLLDEPTSALDAASEAHVQEALDELMKGRTVIVVAHRLATVQHAGRIHVLAGKDDQAIAPAGTIIESGSHGELVARGGVYAGMVAQQQLDG